MNKTEFLYALRAHISQLSPQDIQKSLDYYKEMIDDRMEDGMTEQEAVAAMGPIEEIAAQILMDIPLPRLVRSRLRPTRALHTWEIVLLILGAPVWFPLLLAGIIVVYALIISLYAVIWSLVLTLYAVELTFSVMGVALLPTAILFACGGHVLHGLFLFGAALIFGGLAIAWFFACKYSTRASLWLGKQILLGTKSLFIRKENKA